jgi:hypothetical protein
MFSENIFSDNEKILEEESTLEEEVELSEEKKANHKLVHFNSFDADGGTPTNNLCLISNYEERCVILNRKNLSFDSKKAELFILYCCIKIPSVNHIQYF